MRAVTLPDPRLMERLARGLRAGVGGFAAGGDALALAAMGQGSLPSWAEELADAMLGALLRVQDATLDQADPEQRVALCRATAALSVVRPHAAVACDAAISTWMTWGLRSPRSLTTASALASRTLLALYLDDTADAADSVTVLLDREDGGVGLILHDWVVARVQRHGLGRERGCFRNLHTLAPDQAPLLVLGALVLGTRQHPARDHVLPWLSRIAVEGCGSELPAPQRVRVR